MAQDEYDLPPQSTAPGAIPVATGKITWNGKLCWVEKILICDPSTGLDASVGANGLWVDGSHVTQPISAAALPLPAGAAQDGTDATGVNQLAGGVGIRGWLSGNFSKLSAIAASLAGNLSVVLQAGTNVIGAVTQSGIWNVVLSAGSNIIGAVTQSGVWNITSLINPLPAGTNLIGQVALQPCTYLNLTSTLLSQTVTAVALVGIQSLDGTAQASTFTINIYDGPDSTHPLIAGPITPGAEQVITFPLGGIKCTSGQLTAVCSAAPAGTGVQVLYV